jgi:hypothetical protein
MGKALITALCILTGTGLILNIWLGMLIRRTRRYLKSAESIEQQAEEDLARIDQLYLGARRAVEERK